MLPSGGRAEALESAAACRHVTSLRNLHGPQARQEEPGGGPEP